MSAAPPVVAARRVSEAPGTDVLWTFLFIDMLVFLMIFVVQLLIYGFHELTEANIFPYSEPLHIATEPYGPDGLYGKYLTYLLVLMPMAWLAFATMFGGRKPIHTHTPAQVN